MIRASTFARLRGDTSGLALLEFALSMPIVLALGLYGVEISNLALTNLKLSQIALALADNASRVGVANNLSQQDLREYDVNDVLQAAKLQGTDLKLTANGRITLSSLEESNGVQRIHWQRCLGLKTGTGFDSTYGRTTIKNNAPSTADDSAASYDPTAGVNTASSGSPDNSASHPGSVITGGMGDVGSKVSAPTDSGVMFVEINYNYQPVTGTWLIGAKKLHSIATFIVRDKRNFTQVTNPAPTAKRNTCDLYTA
ncbi:TadE/TadG family type IV pilus assembly protein [Sphingomonas sp. PAMC 26617]|uniref:TadE/TadG family type IV pilus assembly protein n=1 Tax=Sphingomonas sp. PAMC 26617 TaxID=1112216 RepID=UPI000289B195|nr:hypothetical protein [Sphingomonas sp. PAMC 26617]